MTTTQCPQCSTRFKVTQDQLEAHNGLVRCGRCQTVFDAREHLQDGQPSPQLDLLAAQETSQPDVALTSHSDSSAEPVAETPVKATPATPPDEEDEPSLAEQARYEWHDPESPAENRPAALTLAQQVSVADLPQPLPENRPLAWPWAVGSLLLLLVLLGQAAYFFRIEIAASQPGLKPLLVSYCKLLGCEVPLPRKAELMSIDASDIEADPAQQNVIVLHALLRNHAPYTQAYPQLELTLTDAQEKPLARRAFRVAEYLDKTMDEAQGLAAGRELAIRLSIDTADLAPSGYRLFLFYP